ncbi:hypothetical protein [Streptomyces sp. NPDC054887]
MSQTTQTAWPEGVIARYLALGGATVDLMHRLTVTNPPEPFATSAACAGCPAREDFSHWVGSGAHFDGTYKEQRDEEQANEKARVWAQAHAETCRSMPRPTA